MEEKKKTSIGLVSSAVLISAAIGADYVSAVPFVGSFVGPAFWVVVSIYFWMIGLGIVSGRRLAVSVVSMIAEILPVIQTLPTIVTGIVAILIMIKLEEKTGISMNPMKKHGVTPPRNPVVPMNQGGVRRPAREIESEV